MPLRRDRTDCKGDRILTEIESTEFLSALYGGEKYES